MQRVSSRQNAIVGRYRAVAHGDEPDLLLLDGVHLVTDALASGVEMRHLVVAADAVETAAISALVDRAARHGTDIVVATAPVMSAVSPVRSTSPVVALARRPSNASRMFEADPPFVVLGSSVQDPGNIGAIIRVAEAAGASGFIAVGPGADPFGWKALRGSMGSALRLPIAVCGRLAEAVADVKAHDCRLLALVPREGRSVFEADLRGPIALLVGGEGPGLTDDVLALADDRVTVPMEAPVESLNAAVSVAICAYEARRQRC